MAVSFGTNPIAWSNDDMRELGGDTPLEVCLTEARAAGFTGIELGHKFPRDAAALGPILEAHDLKLVSGWYSSALLERSARDEIAALADHLGLLKALGCSVLIFAETSNAIHGDRGTPLSATPRMAPGDWAAFGRAMTEVAAHAADHGLALSYHHHMGTVVQTAADIDAFMNATGDAVGLLLDTGHATFAGADPGALAGDYAGGITHFHAKDVRAEVMDRARHDDMSFLDAVVEGVFTVPGDGCVDFLAPLGELGDIAYDGWLVVEAEQDPDVANPRQYAELGFANLKRRAAEAGLV